MARLRWTLLALLGLAAAAAAQLTAQCSFVGFTDSSESHPMAYIAKCSRGPGDAAPVCSQLDLGQCLSNNNGELRARAGGDGPASLHETCARCHVSGDGWKLYCQCRRLDMSTNYASIELESVIVLKDGLLTCSTTTGTKLSECPVTRLGRPTARRWLGA